VILSGTGAPGKLAVAKTFVVRGSTGQTTQSNLTIRNTGKGLLSGSWTPIADAPYSEAGGSFGPLTRGETSTIPIDFSPTVKGNAATVTLTINIVGQSGKPTVVKIRGVAK
jgi:hypothetical protein